MATPKWLLIPVKRSAQFVVKRFMPWQYDLAARLHNAPRQHIGLDCTAQYDAWLKSYHRQRRIERLFGKTVVEWIRDAAELKFYPVDKKSKKS